MRFGRRALWAVLPILALTNCNQSPEAKEKGFLERGRKEFQKKNYAVAILHFKNAQAAMPWDAEAIDVLAGELVLRQSAAGLGRAPTRSRR